LEEKSSKRGKTKESTEWGLKIADEKLFFDLDPRPRDFKENEG